MNGVIGMAGLLAETELTPEQENYTAIIRESGEQLLTIIGDILDFSKIEAERVTLDRVTFELADVLDETLKQLAPSALAKGLEVLYVLDDAARLPLLGDPIRLRQVIQNLASYVIKFAARGEVMIEVRAVEAGIGEASVSTPESASQVGLHFAIYDAEMGQSADLFNRTKEGYSPVDNAESRRYGATGLSMAISQQLVGLMGGDIGMHRIADNSSAFWFTANFERGLERVEDAVTLPAVVGRPRVLILSAREAMQRALGSLLQGWGCPSMVVGRLADVDGVLQRAAAVNAGFDLVIIDENMESSTGVSLQRLLQGDARLTRAHFLAIAPVLGQLEMARSVQRMAERRLQRPVTRQQLYAALLGIFDAVSEEEEEGESRPISDTPLPRLGEGKRVLLVEDNAVNQMVGVAVLRRLGFEIDIAEHGGAALVALQAQDYALVLMDVHLPIMDGLEATRVIRDPDSTVRDHDVPVLAMTATGMREERDACLAAGMNDFVAKPIQQEQLVETLRRWLPA